MRYNEIDHAATVQDNDEDLGDEYGDRPILATFFAPIDGSGVLVPVPPGNPNGYILALTEEQGMQLLLALAAQVGRQTSLTAITEDEG
jgi:hypothetical protein